MNAAQNTKTPKGYITEQHKQKYTIIVGVLCAVFFLGQFFIPFVFMFPIMTGFMTSSFMNVSHVKVDDGVVWGDHIWVVEEKITPANPNTEQVWICRYPIQGGESLEQVVQFPTANLGFLPDQDRLWLISSTQAEYYMDGTMTTVVDEMALGDISQPFLYQNQPAVVEEHPSGFRLMVLDKDGWQNAGMLKFHFRTETFCLGCDLKVLNLDGRTIWFAKFGDTLYYRDTVPFESGEGHGGWKLAAAVKGSWDVAAFHGLPAFFVAKDGEGFSGKLKGYLLENGNWEQFTETNIGLGFSWGIFPVDQGDRFALLLQPFPGSFRYILVDGNTVTNEIKVGRGSPFPKSFVYLVMLFNLLPYLSVLLLAIILTVIMKNNRVWVYEADNAHAYYASLTKRALAELVDMMLVVLPAGIWAAHAFFEFISDFDKMITQMPFGMLKMFGLWGLFFLWGLACLFLFSYLEGRYGATPGKWLFKIRVTGTDLRPCGFGRAILRNLLKIVDGFFGFLVGITLVALTENWQRLGDLAARTVVIDISRGIEPVETFSFS